MNIYEKLLNIQSELKAPPSKRKTLIKCKECGKEISVRNDYLKRHSGLCMSCNMREREKNKKYAEKHGKSNTRLYKIWVGMKCRRYNKEIEVCDLWKDNFSEFEKWALSNGYKESLTIDRIDNQKGYCPENCQWITLEENASKDKLIFKTLEERMKMYNRRKLENKTQREFAKELGVSRNTIQRNEKIVKEILRYEYI